MIDENFEAMWNKAVEDALLIGMGVLILRPNMSVERIDPTEYHLLSEALDHAQGNFVLGDRK